MLNDAGQVAFIGRLTDTSGGDDDDTGIFRGQGGPLTQIAREAPSGPSSSGLTNLHVADLALNEAGDVAFLATFLQPPDSSSAVQARRWTRPPKRPSPSPISC